MSYIKTTREIALIRTSCRIARDVLAQVVAAVKPGITTQSLNDLAAKATREQAAKPSFTGYLGYPAAICISVNNEVVHGLPSPRMLKEGDIVGLDFGVNYRGAFSDLARTVPVGEVSSIASKLIDTTRRALDQGVAAVKPNNHTGDIGHAVQTFVEEQGFSVVRDLVGHGVGSAVHEPPAIPNYGRAGSGEQLIPGMVIALEPMVNVGRPGVKLLQDGWTFETRDGSLSAHFEDTVLVTERGHEILTRG